MKSLDSWMERDLTADARAGKLEPAFEIDDTVADMAELLEAGYGAIVTGDSGVGRTAAVHELVRRATAGDGPACMHRHHIVEVSLMRKAATLENRYDLREHLQQLVETLRKSGRRAALFIRDIHLAYEFDLEPQLLSLALAFDGPVIGEGPRTAVDRLLESEQSLQQHYVCVQMDEPDLDRTARILSAWADDATARHGQVYTAEALDQALTLTHRFLARGRLPRKALDILRHTAAQVGVGQPVSGQAVLGRFCTIHRIPREIVDPTVPLSLCRLRESFNDRVVGQPEAVDAVVNMIGLMKAGLSDPRRPLGVYLFVGPTGVGKTYVAQVLADRLFGNAERVVRFNMADHSTEHDASVLFGDPHATSAAGARGLLTVRVMAHPVGVVLLDEFEKANAKVHDRFLQLFDEGAFVNGAGETVSCRSMIIIATSNAGAEAYRGQQFGFGGNNWASRLEEARAALEGHFRFELLNRFDRVVHFLPLQREAVRRIAERELAALDARIGFRRGGFKLRLDESIVAWVTDRGYDPEFGARLLRRTIERYVATALAECIVRERPEHGATIVLTADDDRVIARVQNDTDASLDVPQEGSAGRSVSGVCINGRQRRRSIRFWQSVPAISGECP